MRCMPADYPLTWRGKALDCLNWLTFLLPLWLLFVMFELVELEVGW